MTHLDHCYAVSYGTYLNNLQADKIYRIDFVNRGECVLTPTHILNIPGQAVNNIYIRNDGTGVLVQYSINAENKNVMMGGFLKDDGGEREFTTDTPRIKSVNIRALNSTSSGVAIEVFI